MATYEFIFTISVLCICSSLVQSNGTYKHELPSGKTVECKTCAPGSYRQKHCTETQQTVCRPCNDGFFTEVSNYIFSCLPCRLCSSEEVEVQKCTRTTNRVCQCKEGFYWDKNWSMCRPHSTCPHGSGVKEKGTPDKDKVCEPCLNGSYADGIPECVPHTECKSEEKCLIHGTNYMDNVCVTCTSIKNDGWIKYFTPAFIEIFKKHNSSSRKLTGLLRQLKKDSRVTRSITDQDVCIQELQQWLSEATEQEVISELPKLLKNSGMKRLSIRTEQRLKKIQDEVNLCRNTF